MSLSPAGLWRGDAPLYTRVSVRAIRWFAEHATGLLSRVVNHSAGRMAILSLTHGRPSRMTCEYARVSIQAMARCPSFLPTYKATSRRRYFAESTLRAPTTVAFGSRDFILLRRQSRHLDQLPSGTRVGALPGCGHVPMADDPGTVAALIVTSTRVSDRPA